MDHLLPPANAIFTIRKLLPNHTPSTPAGASEKFRLKRLEKANTAAEAARAAAEAAKERERQEKEERSRVREAQIAERKLKTETPTARNLRLKQEEAAARKASVPKAWGVGDRIEAEYEVRSWVNWLSLRT